MEVVNIKNVSKTFRKGKNQVKALDDINFNINKGEIFGLLGPNGAGKTTLISILTSLLEKDSGKVEILGMDMDKELHEIKKKINLMLGFTGIGMSLSVQEFLKYYCLLYELSNADEKIKNALEAVDMLDRKDQITLELSSGYKQRLMLAKALLNEPQVLLLDEPTVGLDVDIAIKIRALIKELKRKGTTILLTTHNMYEVEELCDRIALISHGKIIALGTVEEIKQLIKVDKVIEVEVDDIESFAAQIAKEKFVLSSKVFEDVVHVKVESYSYVKKVMAFLSKSNHIIYSVRLIEPTLEEAFLELTHKQITNKQIKIKKSNLKNSEMQ